ncbi:hypothetical protein ACTFIY_011376 [Dictyostelium cf. discoideum]
MEIKYLLLFITIFLVFVNCEIEGLCDDGDPCTIDRFKILRCEHLQKCQAKDLCETVTCNRRQGGNCTVTPRCHARTLCEQALCDVNTGQCIYTPTCISGDRCSIASCNEETGECKITPKCKPEEICDERGFCVNCSDNNPCTTDFYSPYYGICINIVNEWMNCENTTEYQKCLKGCNTNKCTNAVCDKQTLKCIQSYKDCSDGNLCTADVCDNDLGCIHNNVSCDDGNPCTQDFCDNEYGCHYKPDPTCDGLSSCYSNKDCSDNLDCTTDRCEYGKCTHSFNCGFDQLCNKSYKCEKVRFEN